MEEVDWAAQISDLNPIEHLWNELECQLRARLNRPTSVPNLTNTLVAEWKQLPAAMFQHIVESLPRRVEAVIAAKRDLLPVWANEPLAGHLRQHPVKLQNTKFKIQKS